MAALIKFKIDLKELETLATNYKFRSKKQFHAVIRNTLDNQAFATMKIARNFVLPSEFHIRNKWVQSSVLVEKARRNKIPLFTVSEVGGAARWSRNTGKRFLGLRDQQFGTDRTIPQGIPTVKGSRSGSISKKVSNPRRYNRLGDIKNPDQFSGSSPERRIITMLRTLERQNYKKAFFIRKSTRIKTGVYRFKAGKVKLPGGKRAKKIEMIKDLSFSVARLPKRPWLTTSVRKAVTAATTKRFFRKNAIRAAGLMFPKL